MSWSTCAVTCIVGIVGGATVACGQVIQLPTTRVFSVGTSVLVPDRGSVGLGGVARAASGSVGYGVPGLSGLPGVGRAFSTRGVGSELGSAHAAVSATIIDHGELDRAVLSAAAAGRGTPAADAAVARKAAFLNRHMARSGTLSRAAAARGGSQSPRHHLQRDRSVTSR